MTTDPATDTTASSNPSDSANTDQATSATSPFVRWRLTGLLLILGLMLVALAYDYKIARASVEHAHDEVTELNVMHNAVPRHEVMTNAMVQEIVGKPPAESFMDGRYLVEVYSWPSGLPFRNYHLYAVYQTMDEQQMLFRLHKFKYEMTKDVIPFPDAVMMEATPEQLAEWESTMEAEYAEMGVDTAQEDQPENQDDAGADASEQPAATSQEKESAPEPAPEPAATEPTPTEGDEPATESSNEQPPEETP